MKIEQEFQQFMKQTFSTVPTDSTQYKMSRLLFFAGTFTATNDTRKEATEALAFVSHHAQKGLQPEDNLADYVEGKD